MTTNEWIAAGIAFALVLIIAAICRDGSTIKDEDYDTDETTY